MSQPSYTYGNNNAPIATSYGPRNMAYVPVGHASPLTADQPIQHNTIASTASGIQTTTPAQSTRAVIPATTANNAAATSTYTPPPQPMVLVPISSLQPPPSTAVPKRTYNLIFVPTPNKKKTYHRELQLNGHPIYTITRSKPHFKPRQLNFLDSTTLQPLAGVRLPHWHNQVSITLGDPDKKEGYVKIYQEQQFSWNGRDFEWQRNESTQTRTLVEGDDEERVLCKWKVEDGVGRVEWFVVPERRFEVWCFAAVFALTEARPRERGGNGAGGCGGGCSTGGRGCGGGP